MRYILIILTLFISISVSAQKDIVGYDFSGENRKAIHFVFATNLQVDIQENDFSSFKSLLGDYNINLMNNSFGTFDLELDGFINKWMLGLNYGYQLNSNNDHDSLDLEFNTMKVGLGFGYRVFESKRFIVIPKLNIKWCHYRLINSDNQSKIPISQYIEDRDLDIRFNQITASIGMRLSFKIYKVFPWMQSYDYMSIGIYGGYLVQVNQQPLIYSLRNRLLTDDKIKINHMNLGLSFTFYLD